MDEFIVSCVGNRKLIILPRAEGGVQIVITKGKLELAHLIVEKGEAEKLRNYITFLSGFHETP